MSAKPVLIYDGDCSFCRVWIDYFRKKTGDRVEYAPSQEAADRFPQIPREAFAESVQLVHPDGSVTSGARAVFETLDAERAYRSIAGPSEAAYRFIARRRNFFYRVTKFAFGLEIEPACFALTQWVFVRLLALIYLIAFASLSVQIAGLIGEKGLLPAGEFFDFVGKNFGVTRYFVVPSIFWWASDDRTLTGICYAGMAMAFLLVVTGFRQGMFERVLLASLYVLYLSLSSAGQDFLTFQWDSLLLEAGFLAIFLGRSRIVVWLFRWLVFRLFFLSGSVKLLSHDLTWLNLTALDFHYYTQPLPTVLAWYMNQLPGWFQRVSTAVVLLVELVVPFLIFLPRRIRFFGVRCLVTLQILILLTGNYAFFNLLTIILCLFLLDDRALRGAWAVSRVVPKRVWEKLSTWGHPARFETWTAGILAALVLTLGVIRGVMTFTGDLEGPLRALERMAAPFQIVNPYGLFAVMTTSRNEIVFEGSSDGEHWVPYEFRYKPGDVRRPPRWVEPHQPRLDWQMWFAVFGDYRASPWLVNLAVRLLQGSPPVVSLLAHNPFPAYPPKYVRAWVYEYTFTDWKTRRLTGAWWQRQSRGLYLPPMGLRTQGQR